MDSKALKIIAVVTMTIDHIGQYLVPEETVVYLIMRAIGRIAFPLFAFFIAEGFRHTRDKKAYFVRLMDFAAMFEAVIIAYYLFGGENLVFKVNILWTLAAGLLYLILLDDRKIWVKALSLPLIVLVELVHLPYGAYGIAMIIIFGFVKNNWFRLGLVSLLTLAVTAFPLYELLGLTEYARYAGYSQWFSLVALAFVFLYNGRKGVFNKYFFYFYYPLHLIVIYALSLVL